MMGIMVLSIPITVISTNFSQEYNKLKKQREAMRARILLLRSLTSAKRTGLEAMFDEIEEIVRRNSEEFREQIDNVFALSKEELTEDLKEIAKVAFMSRRKAYEADMKLKATHESTSNKVLPVTEMELTALRRESMASVDIHRRGSVTGNKIPHAPPRRESSVLGTSDLMDAPEEGGRVDAPEEGRRVVPEEGRRVGLEGAPAWAEVEPEVTAT